MMKHLTEKLQNPEDMLAQHKKRKDINLTPAGAPEIEVSRKMARGVMARFSPKHAELVRGQYDATNLKGILNNCSVYAGWTDHTAFNGWLQTFQEIGKMRNDRIGHNNSFRLRAGSNIS